MRKALKFVSHAVAERAFSPVLAHVLVRGGRVLAFNGQLALSYPISAKLEAAPLAAPFLAAVNACTGVESLRLAGGVLVFSADGLTVNIPCLPPEDFPAVTAEGVRYPLAPGLLAAVSALRPFVGTDNVRLWTCGILFSEESLFATNNSILVEYWLGQVLPARVCVPVSALDVLLKLKQDPVAVQCTDDAVVFHFEDGGWLRSSLYPDQWPDVVGMLSKEFPKLPWVDLSQEFFDGVERLQPFADENKRLFVGKKRLSTTDRPDVSGASLLVARTGVTKDVCFNVETLAALRELADHAQLDAYPAAVPFRGDRVRGLLCGVRL